MANGKVHRRIGVATGAFTGFMRSDGQDVWQRVAESVGGSLGGYLGSQVPDWLEPATHPWHRNFAHSMTAGMTVVAGASAAVSAWESGCRRRAAHFAVLRADLTKDGFARLLYLFAEIFWRVAASVVRGIATGYASHLLLDAITPRSIPMFVRQLA